jgi:cytochrome b561
MAQNYTRTAIGLHWVIALCVIAAFLLGLVMTAMPFSATQVKYFSWHKWLGITVFLFAMIRVLWRLTHSPPDLEPSISNIERSLAHAVHLLLYILIFAAPLSGYFYSLAAGVQVVYLGLIPLPALISPNPHLADTLLTLHQIFVYTMSGIVGLHLLGALKHYFIDHDGTLVRMLPFLKK